MRLLLDSHLLLWAASEPERMSVATRDLIATSERYFSAASLWELAIKSALGRRDFVVDVAALHRGLRDNQYRELPITGEHALFTTSLAPIHKDPFDRILVAQAMLERLTLLTVDATLAQYGGVVRLV